MKEVLPFDDINYGIDEQWAAIYPYTQEARPGGSVDLSVRIFNHSAVARTFTLEPDKASGFDVEPAGAALVIQPQSEGRQNFKVKIPENVSSGLSLFFVSVKFDGWDLHEWCESMIGISK